MQPFENSSLIVDAGELWPLATRAAFLDAIAEEDPDPVAPHLPRRVSERLVAVVQLDPEHPVAEGLDHLALHLDLLFLGSYSRSFQ